MGLHGGANQLSSGELEIMEIIWREGPLSIAETRQRIDREIGLTTVQTRLNRLFDKGILRRIDGRPVRYEAAVESQQVAGKHLDLLLKRVGGENLVPMIVHLLKEQRLSPEEIRLLKTVIADTEKKESEK